MSGAKKWIIGGACCFCWLAITIGLLAGSFAVVTPTQLGLKFNAVTVEFDDNTVYPGGRYYVGVGGSFIIFPRQNVYVGYTSSHALDVWSSDGQSIHIEASFYYKLLENRIHDIFYRYGTNFDAVVRAMAAETIRDIATTYATVDFFTNRTEIDNAMTSALTTRLYNDALVNITLFNLLAIDVPDLFEFAVIQKVITAQNMITLEQLRQSQVIQTQIAVVAASATANITALNGNATANGLLIQQRAQASVTESFLTQRAALLQALAADLNITNTADLLQYLATDLIRNAQSASQKVAYNVKGLQVRA